MVRPWGAFVDADGDEGFAATLSSGPALRGPAGSLPALG